MLRARCSRCKRVYVSTAMPNHCPNCGKRAALNDATHEGIPDGVLQRIEDDLDLQPKDKKDRPGVALAAGVVALIYGAVISVMFVFIMMFFWSAGTNGGWFNFESMEAKILGILIAILVYGVPSGLTLAGGIGILKGRPWGWRFSVFAPSALAIFMLISVGLDQDFKALTFLWPLVALPIAINVLCFARGTRSWVQQPPPAKVQSI